MDDVQQRYAELMVAPDMAAAARELKPMNEPELFGRHIFLFDNANRMQLRELGVLELWIDFLQTFTLNDNLFGLFGRWTETIENLASGI